MAGVDRHQRKLDDLADIRGEKMRTKLIANAGMVLTNGEIYGTEIFLAEGLQAQDFYEITMAQYDAITQENPTA